MNPDAQHRPRWTRRAPRILAPALAVGVAVAGWFAVGGGSPSREPSGSSALLPGGITVSPAPAARDASPQTEISFLGASRAELGAVSVVGSRSGPHAGRLVPYVSKRGVSFVPSAPFAPGEQVTIAAAGNLRYHFTVGRPAAVSGSEVPLPSRQSTADALTFASSPALHPARVTVNRNAGAPTGYMFVAPLGIGGAASHGQVGPLIVDPAGNPVWQGTIAPGDVAMNFRPQRYLGKPVLTWWEGRVSPVGYGIGRDVIVDSAYRTVATVQAGNGDRADLHEFQLTRRGAAFITAYRLINADLRAYGGSKNGQLLDSVVQEIDIRTGRVMFEWDSLDHVSLKESYTQPSTTAPWDAVHLNSIDIDGAGHMLVTARNTWAAYEVSTSSGVVSWRLGGKRSTFRLPAADRFAWEHDARFEPNGRVSVFDDEAAPKAGPASRGLVFELDESSHTARTVARYTHPSGLLSSSQGNLQRLPDGNVFVGWGAQPYYSEFNREGQLLYDARLPGPDESYRAYLAAWTGRPATRPALAIKRNQNRGVTLYASWNGATEVASWRVLAGPSPSALAATGSPSARTGFETSIAEPSSARYYAVEALDSAGHVLASSSAVAP